MPTPRNSNYTVYNSFQGSGAVETINSQAVTGYLSDSNGDLLICTGIVLITNGGSGFAKGCMYIKTDVVTGTGATYFNKGTNTSCAFTLATQA